MAPERRNTARVNLDYLAQIKHLSPALKHAYFLLRLDKTGLPYRRFSSAMQHNFVLPDEADKIERAWEAWKRHFLADEKTHYFQLPDELVPR